MARPIWKGSLSFGDRRLRSNAWTTANAKQRLRREDPWTEFYRCRQSNTAPMRRAVGLAAARDR
jgi:hypothetical protein